MTTMNAGIVVNTPTVERVTNVDPGQIMPDYLLDDERRKAKAKIIAAFAANKARFTDVPDAHKETLGFLSPEGEFFSFIKYNYAAPHDFFCDGHSSTSLAICYMLDIKESPYGGAEGTIMDMLGWVKFQKYSARAPRKDDIIWCRKLTRKQKNFLESWFLNAGVSPPKFEMEGGYYARY